jgi:hypothetical protein
LVSLTGTWAGRGRSRTNFLACQTLSSSSRFLTEAEPARMSEWPPRNLVHEWITTCHACDTA